MSFETIPMTHLSRYRDCSRYILADVRPKEDFMHGHIPGAISLPYEELTERMPSLNRKLTYILYCDRGGTSLLAARKMFRCGFDVKSTAGGLAAYRGKLVK